MANGCYYCVPHPLHLLRSDEELSRTNLRIKKHSQLYNALLDHMLQENVRYLALSVPDCVPHYFRKLRKEEKFWKKIPPDYVENVEALLAQGQGAGFTKILVVNSRNSTAEMIDAFDKYESVLLSLFVQSVQQRNPTSRLLYEMVGEDPVHGVGTFAECETFNCCFRSLVVKMTEVKKSGKKLDVQLTLHTRRHLCHSKHPQIDVITKWFNCYSAEY